MASTTIRSSDSRDNDGPAFTIPEFCIFYGFSRPFYYQMKKDGHGPEETRIGRTVRILHAARSRWETAHTPRSKPPASAIGSETGPPGA